MNEVYRRAVGTGSGANTPPFVPEFKTEMDALKSKRRPGSLLLRGSHKVSRRVR